MNNQEKLALYRQQRVGETVVNRHGSVFKIIEYINSKKVLVECQDEYKYKKFVEYSDFTKGKVGNPYEKTMYVRGYIGEGKYDGSGQYRKIYQTWQSMFARCYDQKYHQSCYDGCTVDPIWFNFQNFAEWYENNYYHIDNQRMQVDKDILHKGNTIYSPNNCIIVPGEINMLFVKQKRQRGDTPIGVYYNKNMKSYVAFCWTGGTLKEYLGRYDTQEDAFNAYKIRKEQYIKEIADKYMGKIPQKLYNALYNYKVEIND